MYNTQIRTHIYIYIRTRTRHARALYDVRCDMCSAQYARAAHTAPREGLRGAHAGARAHTHIHTRTHAHIRTYTLTQKRGERVYE